MRSLVEVLQDEAEILTRSAETQPQDIYICLVAGPVRTNICTLDPGILGASDNKHKFNYKLL